MAETSVSQPCVFLTSVVRRVADSNVVYHQTVGVIFVQHRESWVMSKITKPKITEVNESLSRCWCV